VDNDQSDLFYVGVRKYGLDKDTPWWERWFFRAIYLPFVRFAFKRLHIPAQGTYHEDGSFSWVENIGVATDEQAARDMCEGEFYEVRPIPLNGALPKESIQYKEPSYPRAKSPGKYARRAFRLEAVRRKDVEMIREVEKRADRLLMTARSG
jgi:hypothetical protein